MRAQSANRVWKRGMTGLEEITGLWRGGFRPHWNEVVAIGWPLKSLN